MIITITYTDGVKKKYDNIIEIYQPNNSEHILLTDSTGVKSGYVGMIKKIEVKP